jgi:hypothetical protein
LIFARQHTINERGVSEARLLLSCVPWCFMLQGLEERSLLSGVNALVAVLGGSDTARGDFIQLYYPMIQENAESDAADALDLLISSFGDGDGDATGAGNGTGTRGAVAGARGAAAAAGRGGRGVAAAERATAADRGAVAAAEGAAIVPNSGSRMMQWRDLLPDTTGYKEAVQHLYKLKRHELQVRL